MLENIINRILNRNRHYLAYLNEIAGCTVAVRLIDLPIAVTLLAHHTFIEVKTGVHEADLYLQGSSKNFLIFASQKEQRQKLLQEEKIRFEGDLMVLQRCERFLNHFRVPQVMLAPLIQGRKFMHNQVEYWQEEQKLLASPILFDYFKDEVLDVQQELSRLNARLQVLEVGE